LEPDAPFAVCAKCLFGAALEVRSEDAPISSDAGLGSAPVTSKGRLFPRRDFFDKYELLEPVARGGQGEVWRAWDLELRRCVAMKRLSDKAMASESAWYRFLAEAQITSQLEHPGVLPVFDVGLDPDGRPYYATQLLPGTTLAEIWRRILSGNGGEWTISRALELLVRVCEVMAHAHSRGVIHRDLKPSNILVGPFGDVRVIDWGSAHVSASARASFEETFVPLNREVVRTDRAEAMDGLLESPLSTSVSGQPITFLYAPHEVHAGKREEVGPTTDVYSIGVILYELVAGRLPYSGTDGKLPEPAELRQQILGAGAPAVRSVNPGASRDLAAICDKAMARARDDRYQSVTGLADDLRAVLEVRTVSARRPGPWLRLQKWALRNRGYVLLGGVSLMLVSAALFVVRGLRAERDVARQVTALRSAELAARSGHWREALRLWDVAEGAGYRDRVYLGLQRAEAWTVLSESERSGRELSRLSGRSDLGVRRGEVLLRLGEHELFDSATFEQGARHIREALEAGLGGADEELARGLLAESTPRALEHLSQALRLNPYLHNAHRHSLGLEHLLGRRAALAEHLRVFKVLYPDDPSPVFIEASELALAGRLAEAEQCLERLKEAASPGALERFRTGLRVMGAAVDYFNVRAWVAGQKPEPGRLEQMAAEAIALSGGVAASDNGAGGSSLRAAQLPCLQSGIQEGVQAARLLMMPLAGSPEMAVRKIQASWRRHPEALLPVFAGSLLARGHPREGQRSLALLALQAELYQMGADSSSVLPGLPGLARHLAARAQFELATRQGPGAAAAREACVRNLGHGLRSDEPAPVECRSSLEMALALKEHDLARSFLVELERLLPDDPDTLRSRILVETACGAYGDALESLRRYLNRRPADAWAGERRGEVLRRMRALLENDVSHSNPQR
jgi:serine/threonine protein kinase